MVAAAIAPSLDRNSRRANRTGMRSSLRSARDLNSHNHEGFNPITTGKLTEGRPRSKCVMDIKGNCTVFRVSDVDFASGALLTCPEAVPAHDRPNHLALSHHREAWRRRNGCGLQG